MDKQHQSRFQIFSEESPNSSNPDGLDISVFFAWNDKPQFLEPSDDVNSSHSEQPVQGCTKPKEQGRKNQIEDPSEAAKKQARVWICQAINIAFETDILGSLKNRILHQCFPSRSKRPSGDAHASKFLGYLGHLNFEEEINALVEIIIQIERKMERVSLEYTGDKSDFCNVILRWMRAMVDGINTLMEELGNGSSRGEAITKAMSEYLKKGGNNPTRKVSSGNLKKCRESYLQGFESTLN